MSSETQRMIRATCLIFILMLCDDNLFEGRWRLPVCMLLMVLALSDFEHKKLEK